MTTFPDRMGSDGIGGSEMTPEEERVFNGRVRLDQNSGCLLWTAGRCVGYGSIRVEGKSAYAHRVAWTLRHGAIPAGLYVLHKCDVRLCVNPDHLYLGTQKDNMGDVHLRDRGTKSKVLTPDQIAEIDRRIRAGATRLAMAKEYGVWRSTVTRLVLRFRDPSRRRRELIKRRQQRSEGKNA